MSWLAWSHSTSSLIRPDGWPVRGRCSTAAAKQDVEVLSALTSLAPAAACHPEVSYDRALPRPETMTAAEQARLLRVTAAHHDPPDPVIYSIALVRSRDADLEAVEPLGKPCRAVFVEDLAGVHA
jgi:hypothetical protein